MEAQQIDYILLKKIIIIEKQDNQVDILNDREIVLETVMNADKDIEDCQ